MTGGVGRREPAPPAVEDVVEELRGRLADLEQALAGLIDRVDELARGEWQGAVSGEPREGCARRLAALAGRLDTLESAQESTFQAGQGPISRLDGPEFEERGQAAPGALAPSTGRVAK